jgi:hypothetical protein
VQFTAQGGLIDHPGRFGFVIERRPINGYQLAAGARLAVGLSWASAVELRGIEPLALPAEMGSEQRRLFVCVVTQRLRVLRIRAGVLRDVTVLGLGQAQRGRLVARRVYKHVCLGRVRAKL